MKLYFAWLQSEGDLSPSCTSDVVNADSVSPLCCLLTDDGGQKFLDTVSWLNEGIERLKSVKVSGSDVVQQVTVKTQSGVKTRLDIKGTDAEGNIFCIECKASATAPLTLNQRIGFPEK